MFLHIKQLCSQRKKAERAIAKDAKKMSRAIRRLHKLARRKRRLKQAEDRRKLRQARRDIRKKAEQDTLKRERKMEDISVLKMRDAKERLQKAQGMQKEALGVVKKMQRRRLRKVARGKKNRRLSRDSQKLAKHESVLAAQAQLSAEHLRREEISAAIAMKVKMLKIESHNLEKQALAAQRRANGKAQKAREAERDVLRLQKEARQNKKLALRRLRKENKKRVQNMKQKQARAKMKAKAQGKLAETEVRLSNREVKEYKKDQSEAHSTFKRAANARAQLKVTEKDTEAAGIAVERANKKFAKMKYQHAVQQLHPDPANSTNTTASDSGKASNLKYPGNQLAVRVAASAKNVADLKFKKAKETEKAAALKATVLGRKAEIAKKKDGKKAIKDAKKARFLVKSATIDQTKSNQVYQREERAITQQNKRTERAVEKVMSAKTGISHAKQAASAAVQAAREAAVKAKQVVKKARLTSLKLRDTIVRSAKAVAAMDREYARTIRAVLPSATRSAADAWRAADHAHKQLKRFRKMANEGRKRLSQYNIKLSKEQQQHQKDVGKSIDRADGLLRDALHKIADADQKAVPMTFDYV